MVARPTASALGRFTGDLGEQARPIILCEYAHAMGNSLEISQITGMPSEPIRGYKVALFGTGLTRG